MLISSATDLKTLKGDIGSVFSKFHGTELREDERYYELEFGDLLSLPAKFAKEAVVLPTAREVIEAAADHVSPQFRRVVVPRRTADAKGTAQAQGNRRFYEALLNYLERQATVSPYREAIKHMSIYGISVLKLLYDQSKYPPEPHRSEYATDEDYEAARSDWRAGRAVAMPFALKPISPAEVYFDLWHDPPEWVLEVSTRYVADIAAAYPNWANTHNRRLADKLTVYEYWDKKCRSVLVDEAPALATDDGSGVLVHTWGAHPYIITASGLGVDSLEHLPEKKFVSLTRYIRGVLLSESRNYSIADIVMKAGAWPIRVAEGERANEMPILNLEYGQIQPLPPGVTVKDLTPQLPPEMVFAFLQLSNAIISSAAAPRAVRGLHQPGVTSGFDRQLILGEARLRYGSLAFATEMMLTNLCVKAAEYMVSIPIPSVSVASGAKQDEFVTVDGKDFANNRAVSVIVNVLEPEDEVRKHQDGLSMVAGGVMSPYSFIQKYRPDADPETELGRIIGYRLLNSQEVMAIIGRIVLQRIGSKMGLEELIAQLTQAGPAAVTPGSPAVARRPMAPTEAPPEGQGAGSRPEQAFQRELEFRGPSSE